VIACSKPFAYKVMLAVFLRSEKYLIAHECAWIVKAPRVGLLPASMRAIGSWRAASVSIIIWQADGFTVGNGIRRVLGRDPTTRRWLASAGLMARTPDPGCSGLRIPEGARRLRRIGSGLIRENV
jgi:hypothetical protein